MLRLNISIILSFLRICLNFMNSSADDNMNLVEWYKQRVRFNDLYAEYSPLLAYDSVCNMPRKERVAFCRKVLRRLRSQNEGNIYTNYLAFIEQEPCTRVKVWINEGNVLAHQTALNCFGRPAIPALDSQEEMVYFYRRIVIYPQSVKYMWVFEYNENEDYYEIRKNYLLSRQETHKSPIAYNKPFSIPTPLGWGNISNLFTILYPIHQQLIDYSNPTKNPSNIVHSSRKFFGHYRICFLVFSSETYKKKFNYNTKITKKSKLPKKLKATLRGPNDDLSVSIITYNCNNSVNGDKDVLSNYNIAAGPGDHSVILLEDVNSGNNDDNHIPHYVIIGLVQYMTEDYISTYFEKFY